MFFKRSSATPAQGSGINTRAEFERIAVPEFTGLFRTAYYLTKDRDQAQDLVQETFARAFRFFDKFQRGTNCRAWLITIMRNLFYSHYRRGQEEPELVDWEKIEHGYESLVNQPAEEHRGNPASRLVFQSMDDDVDRALKTLPEEFRSAVVLVDIEELSYDEASRALDVPVGTIRSRVSRGRRLLHVALRDYAIQHGFLKE